MQMYGVHSSGSHHGLYEQTQSFSNKQYGFLRGRSTATRLLQVLYEWTEATEHSYSVECVYMDFSKAFDSVPHKGVLHQLGKYNIDQEIITWVEHSYVVGHSK